MMLGDFRTDRNGVPYMKKCKYHCDYGDGEHCHYREESGCIYNKVRTVNTWKHLWDTPDGSFKGRCENCGFVHFFIEGHDSQYRFCPQCGEQKVT